MLQAKQELERERLAELERIEKLRIADLVYKQGGAIVFIREYRKRRV